MSVSSSAPDHGAPSGALTSDEEPATGDYAGKGVTSTGSADPTLSSPVVGEGNEESSSTADVASGEVANVKDTAIEAGRNVATTAKNQAASVVEETKQQARGLLQTVGSAVWSQASSEQQRIASAVHSLSNELNSMASATDELSPLADLAQQASHKGSEIAQWLENREPRDVLEEVRRFARRRPLLFLSLCAAAGVVAGRLARSAAANTSLVSTDSDSSRHAALPSSAAGSTDQMPGHAAGSAETPATSEAAAGRVEWEQAYEPGDVTRVESAGTRPPGPGEDDGPYS